MNSAGSAAGELPAAAGVLPASRSVVDHPLPDARWILLAVGALGTSCVMTQLVLMRELLEAFSGNELVLGIVLGAWLLLMGVGAALGPLFARRAHALLMFASLQFIIAVLPLLQILAIRGLRNCIFVSGAEVGLTQILLATFTVLLPYCLVAGAALTVACAVMTSAVSADRSTPDQPSAPIGAGHVYIADTLGSVLGGGLFVLLVARTLGHLALLTFPAVLNLLLLALLAWRSHHPWLGRIGIVAAVLVPLLVFGTRSESRSTRWQYPGQSILADATSPYGRIVVATSGGELNFIETGVPLVSTHQAQRIEETVHYAMAQRTDAGRVLLVSGGVSGTVQELRKYGAVAIDYAELDPKLLDLGRQFLPTNLTGAAVFNTDARLLIERGARHYDVIIVDLPTPATGQLNRFFTVEFFAAVKSALAADGVLAFGLSHYENYVSPELARVLSSARRSVLTSFRNCLLLPGGRVFFLASDGPLFTDVAQRLEQKGIATTVVNRHYLEATFSPDRLADVMQAANQPTALNRDFSPVLYFYNLRHWASQFGRGFGLPIALGLALCVYVLFLRGPPLVLFASGFAGAALEFVLLLSFQVLCGSVYYQVIIITTVFMAGLALGAMMGASPGSILSAASRGPGSLAFLCFALAALAALLSPTIEWLARLGLRNSLFASELVLALLTLVLASLVGLQFPVANRLRFADSSSIAARLYAADFLGAALGALLTSTLLLPLMGMRAVGYLAALLNAVAGVLLLLRKTSP